MCFVAFIAIGLTLSVGDVVPVRVAYAEAPLPPLVSVSAPGRVEPYSEERDLAATAVGKIVYVRDEGEKIAAGDIVAEIDNADLVARLSAAEARITMRENELDRLNNGAREEERHEAEAAVAEAEAVRHFAEIDLQRTLPLAGKGFASMQALDRARADAASATAHTRLLAERLALLKAPPRPEDVAIAAANLAMAKADAAALKAEIEKTRLRSPIDGVVLRRYKTLGETVSYQPPTLIAKVGDVSKLRVRADVDEADVGRVATGQRVSVAADAYPGQRFMGTVTIVGLRLGQKEMRTDEPTEKLDTKVLQVLVDLDENIRLPIGLRVDVSFAPLSTNVAEKLAELNAPPQ